MLSLVLISLILISAMSAAALPKFGSGCAGVHIITARASGEAPGEGILHIIAAGIQLSSLHTVSRDSVVYPATLSDYLKSSAAGTAALKLQLEKQVEKCGSQGQKIVLMGYSQGAHVVGDALSGGGGGRLGPVTEPVSSEIGEHVKAVVLMGDPRHVPGEPFQCGTTKFDSKARGVFPRLPEQEAVLASPLYKHKIVSYCDEFDKYCALPGNSSFVHATYVFRYKIQAIAFVDMQVAGLTKHFEVQA